MPIWKIEPSAEPDDSRWLDHAIWREVIVRAPTASLARLEAGKLERDPNAAPAGNELPSFHSAFADETLYRVHRIEPLAASDSIENSGESAILRAEPLGRA
ncbi:MAG: hypothetical protein ACREDZ_03730 [Kiloniellales bacterium]